ncbi:hypothetical protein ABE099_00580 [Paenibacillus turicensis]|uniref:hypothetical protein n=1 Tax=Paenibacillus turicensis TaxID=160487 RepID=UPI003D271394
MKKLAILLLTFSFILAATPVNSIQAASKTTKVNKTTKATKKAETSISPDTEKDKIVTTPEWIKDIVNKKPIVVKNPVTRSQLASLIVKATSQTGSNTTNTIQAFNDVNSTNPVNTVVALGFIDPNNYPNGFKGNTPVTRYELATWLSNGLAQADQSFAEALKDMTGDLAIIPLREFNLGKLDKGMFPAISVVMGTGLMNADQKGEFRCDEKLSIEEVTKILDNYKKVATKKAMDFYGLNELREVALTGTNMVTSGYTLSVHNVAMTGKLGGKYNLPIYFDDPEWTGLVSNPNIKDFYNKKIKVRNNIADIYVHKLIFINHYSDTSIYQNMFFGKKIDMGGTYEDTWLFAQYSFTSNKDKLNHNSIGDYTTLDAGWGISTKASDIYGVLSYPRDRGLNNVIIQGAGPTKQIYNKGEGETQLWSRNRVHGGIGISVLSDRPNYETVWGFQSKHLYTK